MRAQMITTKVDFPLLDIVGTGGDGLNTINISTGSALLAASCGVKVAKHGNRSVSSMCGSADVLAQLGVHIDLCPPAVKKCIKSNNFGFFYAPNFHPVMQQLKSIRKKLALPTIFNLIGPLLNPANAEILMIGVADSTYLNIIAQVLIKLGVTRALVFNCSGMDEICCVAPIHIIEINQSESTSYTLDPADYGFESCSVQELQGGAPENNAQILQTTLAGKPGPIADTLILNAGLANYLYGVCASKEEGIARAKEAHATGNAYKLLQNLAINTQQLATTEESMS